MGWKEKSLPLLKMKGQIWIPHSLPSNLLWVHVKFWVYMKGCLAMLSLKQYVIVDENVCKNFKFIPIKSTQSNLNKCINKCKCFWEKQARIEQRLTCRF